MASKSLKAFIAIAIVAALAFTAVPTMSDESDAATVSSATGTISFHITGSDAYLGDTSTMVSFTLVYSYTPYDAGTPDLKVEYSAKAVDENGRIVDTMAGTETITGPVSNVSVDGPSAYARDVFSHSSGTATATATVTGAGELTGTVYMYVGSQVYGTQSISIKVGSAGSSGAAPSESTTTDKDGNVTTTTTNTKESADGTRTTTSTSVTKDKDGNDVSKTESTETVRESASTTVVDKTSTTTDVDNASVTEKTTTTTDKSTGKVSTESETVSKDADGNTTSEVKSSTTVEKNDTETTTITETTKTAGTEKIESSTTRVADSKGTTIKSETSTTTTNTETGETKTVTKNYDAEKAVDDSKVESSAEVGDAKIETSAEHVFENGDVKSSEATTTVDKGASSEMDISSDLAKTAIGQLRDALSGIGHDVKDRSIGFVSGTDSRLNVAMGSSYFGSIADAKASVSFRSGVMGVSFGVDISNKFAGYDEKISLSLGFGAVGDISKAQRNAIGDRTFVDVKAYAGNSSVHELGGDAIVSADYELPKGVDASHVKVWYIDDNGKAHGMETTWADGKVSFKTTHFSTFVIAEDDSYSEDEGSSTMVIVAVIACVVIVAAVVAVWYTKKN